MYKVTHQFNAMGSPCALVIYESKKNSSRSIVDQVLGEVSRLEHKYSRYRSDSVTSEINRAAKHTCRTSRRISLDQETAALLDYANVAFEQSAGLFDITSGVFREAWDFGSGRLPLESAIQQIKQRVGWNRLSWKNPELSFSIAGMQLDFGGYVKEYAVDRVCLLLKKMKVKHGLIDMGGDIGVVGPRPDGESWNIGIRDPREPERAIASIELESGAIASSGDYERFMQVNGKRYCHILNPIIGWPVSYWSSVSVVADQCLVAGSASTITMLKEYHGLQWVKELGLTSLCINNLGEITSNTGFSAIRDLDDADSVEPFFASAPA